MSPVVFLDRDGVINYDYGYISKVEDFKIIPGVFDALKRLQMIGFKLIIFTNQSGIGRGIITNEGYDEVNEYMKSTFKKNKINILEVFHCPHLPKDNCKCRKPKPGMIQLAMKKFEIDVNRSIVIGDKPTDIQAGIAAGISKNFLISDRIKSKNNLIVCKSLYDLVCESNIIKL